MHSPKSLSLRESTPATSPRLHKGSNNQKNLRTPVQSQFRLCPDTFSDLSVNAAIISKPLHNPGTATRIEPCSSPIFSAGNYCVVARTRPCPSRQGHAGRCRCAEVHPRPQMSVARLAPLLRCGCALVHPQPQMSVLSYWSIVVTHAHLGEEKRTVFRGILVARECLIGSAGCDMEEIASGKNAPRNDMEGRRAGSRLGTPRREGRGYQKR